MVPVRTSCSLFLVYKNREYKKYLTIKLTTKKQIVIKGGMDYEDSNNR
ncbi:hypothetical protein V438_04015 [Clostridioides difficile]|nr:hypothetical protein V439_11730 [Clostridioides difficile]CCK89504.1 hypothetical protein BN163_560005 [Clostridioides difficile T5]CCK93012.1 hypothetical protein BN164_510005 [Clostridioides difficile T20]CCK96640.1 hypothetical protein BN165_530005 [Clostridioides difficile E1]CCL00620.1 hypothetical protein BN166_540005 [Clostridioides difficile E10]